MARLPGTVHGKQIGLLYDTVCTRSTLILKHFMLVAFIFTFSKAHKGWYVIYCPCAAFSEQNVSRFHFFLSEISTFRFSTYVSLVASFPWVVLPGFPGERDTLVHLHQSYVVVVELRHISVFECFDVVIWVDDHLLGNHEALTWGQKNLTLAN